MAKKDYTWVWIAILIAVVVYGGSQGWFSRITNITNQDIINQLENPNNPEGVSCNLQLDKSVMTKGDQITGTISDGKNTFCEVFGKYEGIWQKVFEGTTNANGQLTNSEYLNLVGDYLFVAICDECTTNSVALTVNDVSETCTDSDGGIIKGTPGHVTIGDDSIYDTCTSDNLGVIEYYCLDNALAGETISCDPGSCIATRSGGYCGDSSSSGWEEGDIIYSESGESGISGGTITIKYIDLEDYGFLPGGTCHPEVILHTYWDYQSAEACQGMTAAQAVKWSFYDSTRPAPRWTRTDITPPSNLEATIYPVSWDGTNPWHLDVGMVYQIPGCNVMYNWDLKIKIAECD